MTLEILRRGEKGLLLWPIKYCKSVPMVYTKTHGWQESPQCKTHTQYSLTWLFWIIKLTVKIQIDFQQIDQELDAAKRLDDEQIRESPRQQYKI